MTATSRTPVSVLHELGVHRGILPVYEINDDRSPTHMLKFICKVTYDDLSAEGEGRSKKEAKHAAAEKMLSRIQTTAVPSPYERKMKEDSVGPLTDFCSEYGIRAPDYSHTRAEGPPHATMFTSRCSVGSFCSEAILSKKQDAKQLAACYMLTRLKKMVDARVKINLPDSPFIDPAQEPDFQKVSAQLTNSKFSEFKKILAGNLTHQLTSDFVQFKNTFHKDSEVYDDIKNMIDGYKDFDHNAYDTLTSILEKAEFKYILIPVESDPNNICSVILNIDCNPNLNILESGSTYHEACHNVSMKTLQYLKILCFSEESCHEDNNEKIDFESLINVKKKSC